MLRIHSRTNLRTARVVGYFFLPLLLSAFINLPQWYSSSCVLSVMSRSCWILSILDWRIKPRFLFISGLCEYPVGIVICEQIAKNALVISYACLDRIHWVLKNLVLTSSLRDKTCYRTKPVTNWLIVCGRAINQQRGCPPLGFSSNVYTVHVRV